MSDTLLFMIGLGVFGVALTGAMWSVIPAEAVAAVDRNTPKPQTPQPQAPEASAT